MFPLTILAMMGSTSTRYSVEPADPGAALTSFLIAIVMIAVLVGVMGSIPSLIKNLITMGVASYFATRSARDIIREYYQEKAKYEASIREYGRPYNPRNRRNPRPRYRYYYDDHPDDYYPDDYYYEDDYDDYYYEGGWGEGHDEEEG